MFVVQLKFKYFSMSITVEDVKKVADDNDIFISTTNANKVVELFPFEAEANQGATQDQVIESMLEEYDD